MDRASGGAEWGLRERGGSASAAPYSKLRISIICSICTHLYIHICMYTYISILLDAFALMRGDQDSNAVQSIARGLRKDVSEYQMTAAHTKPK